MAQDHTKIPKKLVTKFQVLKAQEQITQSSSYTHCGYKVERTRRGWDVTVPL